MPGAGVILLRAERRCEASELALVCAEREDPSPLFAFPGIWRSYKGPVKKDGPNVDIETYAFLTTTPNPLVATINHERMPVLLTREEEFETWLKAPPAEALTLAKEYPPEQMQIVREGVEKQDLLEAA